MIIHHSKFDIQYSLFEKDAISELTSYISLKFKILVIKVIMETDSIAPSDGISRPFVKYSQIALVL
jgi:hypothetical protein